MDDYPYPTPSGTPCNELANFDQATETQSAALARNHAYNRIGPAPQNHPLDAHTLLDPQVLTGTPRVLHRAPKGQARVTALSTAPNCSPTDLWVEQLRGGRDPGSDNQRVPRHGKPPPEPLEAYELHCVLAYIETHSRAPARDSLIAQVPSFSGAIAAEIANIETRNVFDHSGEPLDYLFIRARSKGQTRARKIPMHWKLRDALVRFKSEMPHARRLAWRLDGNGQLYYQSAAAIQQWFKTIFSAVGLRRTSTSGRLWFTRQLLDDGASPLDIQRLLGHHGLPKNPFGDRPVNRLEDTIVRQLGSGV